MWRDIRTFFSMTGAVLKGRYPVPWKTLLVALLCIVYVFWPVDILPDVLPLLGITDDVTFMALVLAMIKQDLNKYRASMAPPKDNVIDIGDIKEHKK